MAAAPPPSNPITLLIQGPTYRYGGLVRPLPPQLPSTTEDIIEATRLSTRAGERHRGAYGPGSPLFVNDNAFAACLQYQHAVTGQSLVLAGAPPWFQAWNAQSFQPLVGNLTTLQADVTTLQGDVTALQGDVAALRGVPADITALRADVTALRADVTTVKDNLNTLTIRDARSRNSKHLLDDNEPFYEVPFSDGRSPWGLVVHVPNTGNVTLPRLDNLAAVQGLSLAESHGYFAGYFPTHPVITGPHTLTRQRTMIASAIGRIL
ncbi:hypothetical protein CPB85DRAFT_1330877 [Mucidula mucida]|nr:hypothetical protein CPB85DRAFT_1330877 [Mucidula mucida]